MVYPLSCISCEQSYQSYIKTDSVNTYIYTQTPKELLFYLQRMRNFLWADCPFFHPFELSVMYGDLHLLLIYLNNLTYIW